MLHLLGPAPIAPATAFLLAHPEQPDHLGWSSARAPHRRPDDLAQDLASAGLSTVFCPDCGAEMRPEAIRTFMSQGGLYGLGHALDVELCCHPCGRFVALSALFAGLALACGFAAAEALAARSDQPKPPRDRWPAEAQISLSDEYQRRGPGWGGGGIRRTWTLPGPVVVEVTMGDWQSEGGRTYGEDLDSTITWPDGGRSWLDGAQRPLRLRHERPDGAERSPDEITRALDALVAAPRRVSVPVP